MANRIVAGLVAGAAGIFAHDAAAYGDMLLRGRPVRSLPARVAGRIADEIGLPLDFELAAEGTDDVDPGVDPADEAPSGALANRQEALGALMRMTAGLGIGLAYAVARLALPRPPTWIAGAALGALAMAGVDYPATRLGLTDPQGWSGTDWAADVVPNMAYGLATAATFEAIRG
jgi:xanthosine utilization system XapX-like protein